MDYIAKSQNDIYRLLAQEAIFNGKNYSVGGIYKEQSAFIPLLLQHHNPNLYIKEVSSSPETKVPFSTIGGNPAQLNISGKQALCSQTGSGFDPATEEALENPIKITRIKLDELKQKKFEREDKISPLESSAATSTSTLPEPSVPLESSVPLKPSAPLETSVPSKRPSKPFSLPPKKKKKEPNHQMNIV